MLPHKTQLCWTPVVCALPALAHRAVAALDNYAHFIPCQGIRVLQSTALQSPAGLAALHALVLKVQPTANRSSRLQHVFAAVSG